MARLMNVASFWAAAARAEWTKLRTEPGLIWTVAALPAIVVATGWLSVRTASVPTCPPEEPGCELPVVDIVGLSLNGVHPGQIAAIMLAVLMVTDEYATGLIHTTLTAVPHRLGALAAKAAVVTGVVVAVSVPAVAGSVAVGRWALPDRGFTAAAGYPPLSLADGPTLRAAAGSVLYLVLIALLSLGIAVAIRDTAAALTVIMSVLYLLPVVGMVSDERWMRELTTDYLPAWPDLEAAAAWAGAAVVGGALLFRARDA